MSKDWPYVPIMYPDKVAKSSDISLSDTTADRAKNCKACERRVHCVTSSGYCPSCDDEIREAMDEHIQEVDDYSYDDGGEA